MLWLLLGIVLFLALIHRAARDLERRAHTPVAVVRIAPDGASIAPRTTRARHDVEFSFVVPCYNEATRILETLQSTTAFLDAVVAGTQLKYEIVVVDDGSKDTTLEVVQNFSQYAKQGSDTFRLFKLERNCGKGVAVMEGMLRSRGALCLFMDADNATEITEFRSVHEQLMQLLGIETDQVIKDYGAVGWRSGIVIGSRAHLQSKAVAQRSAIRNFLMHGFHWLVWLVTLTPIQDTQCGFKLFTRKAMQQIFPHLKIRRWCFDVEVLLLARKFKIPVKEVPVKWREVAGSKVKPYHIAHMAWELAVVFFGYTVLRSWKIWKTTSRH